MTTYIRQKPCRSCNQSLYRESDHRCVACSTAASRRYSKAQTCQIKAIKDYARYKIDSADQAQAFMARVLCTFAAKTLKALKYKPEQIMNMLTHAIYDELMVYDFQQLLASQTRSLA